MELKNKIFNQNLSITSICLLTIFLYNSSYQTKAQSPYSVHYYESKKYNSIGLLSEKEWDKFNGFTINNTTQKSKKNYTLHKEIFGWHPYWQGSSYYNYDYSLLTEISYFSYEVDAATGEAITIRDWLTTDLVNVAQSHYVKVSLTVTLFADHELFLTNQTAIDALINNLIYLIQIRNADGVNIDFEAIPESQSSTFTAFMQELCIRFHEEIPGSRVSIAIPAVDWRNVFNVSEMNNYVDLLLIMGYGYHWSGSDKAGPISPKNSGSIWPNISTTQSINYYLENGVSPEKLCLAVPYYGRDWETSSDVVPSATSSTGVTVKYSESVTSYMDVYTEYWDEHASCPAYIYMDSESKWHQCWVDNAQSLGYKYDHVNLMDIAGIGIWAMGYEGDNMHLSNMISEKFTNKDKTISEDVFTDTGGAFGNYFEDENWTYTILAPENKSITLVFEQLSIEQDADSLFVFDGATPATPLLRTYSGYLSIIDTIKSQTNALCFRFKSNESSQDIGWLAQWFSYNETSKIDNVETQNFSAYPNPFSKNITISLYAGKTQNSEVFIVDLKGRLIYTQTIFLKQGTNSIHLNLNEKLEKGSYILGIKVGENYKMNKIFCN